IDALGNVASVGTRLFGDLGSAIGDFWTGALAAGQRAIAGLKTLFMDLKQTVTSTWGGILDAIAIGDLAGALKIGMLGLKAGWAQLFAYFDAVWLDFKGVFMNTWDDVLGSIQKAWIDFGVAFRTNWMSIIGFLEDTFAPFEAGQKAALIDAKANMEIA